MLGPCKPAPGSLLHDQLVAALGARPTLGTPAPHEDPNIDPTAATNLIDALGKSACAQLLKSFHAMLTQRGAALLAHLDAGARVSPTGKAIGTHALGADR